MVGQEAVLNAVLGSLLTTLVPLVVIAIVPAKPSRFALSLLVALAAGAMLGDVLLHQLPELYSTEGHGHEHHDHHHDHHVHDDHHGSHLSHDQHDHDHHDHHDHRDHHDHDHDHHDHAEHHDAHHGEDGHGSHSHGLSTDALLLFSGVAVFFALDGLVSGVGAGSEHGHSHGDATIAAPAGKKHPKKTDQPQSHTPKGAVGLSLPSRAWLCIFADSAHNFTDGVLIGVASLGPSASLLRTAAAVVAHELPHELGDVAVLMDSGLSRRQVLAVQIATGMANLAGAVITVVAASVANSVADRMGPFVTGTFLYLSIGVLLGDVSRSEAAASPLKRLAHVVAFAAGLAVFQLSEWAGHA